MDAPIIFNPPFGSAASFPLLAPDGLESEPPYSFASDPDTGMYSDTVGALNFTSGGFSRVRIISSAFSLRSNALFGWTSGTPLNTQDVVLARDAAATLAQRNGTNPQAFRVYNTYTDASNYERARFAWVSNTLIIGTEAAGTGNNRAILISPGGNGRWRFAVSGLLNPEQDNASDLGATSARVRNGFFGGYVVQGVVAVASLPAAGTAGAGARMIVNDANAPTFGAIVAGGGAAIVPVYSDGTNWLVG